MRIDKEALKRESERASKKTVVFDFDGVIHSYKTGWNGDPGYMPDPPVEGIKEAIQEIRKAGYEVVVVSTRCITEYGKHMLIKYLEKYEIEVDGVKKEKPPAIVYVDDRAICFDGDTSTLLQKIKDFKPWNSKK